MCYRESGDDQLQAYVDEVRNEGRMTEEMMDVMKQLEKKPEEEEEEKEEEEKDENQASGAAADAGADASTSQPRQQQVLKALFNIVSTLKTLSCMAIHAISVFGKVYKWSPEKTAPQKHH